MKAFYSFLLLVAVALTACDEEITKKLIQLADGTSTSLVFNADENGDATIKFTADAAWTASVSEVRKYNYNFTSEELYRSISQGRNKDCLW